MIKRGNKRGLNAGTIGSVLLVGIAVAVIIYFIFQAQETGEDILDVVPSNLAILVSGCEGISQTGGAFLSASCGDFKDLGKVEGHSRYGSCDYILGKYQKSGSNIDCSSFNVDVAAKEFCIQNELKEEDYVNSETCEKWKA